MNIQSRYSHTGNYYDFVQNEAQMNIICYTMFINEDMSRALYHLMVLSTASYTLIQTPPSHYDELVLKKDMGLGKDMCESVTQTALIYRV